MTAAVITRRGYTGRNAGRSTIGWTTVAALHVLIGWALVSGTARHGLALIKKPLEAAVIQEVIIPPPPPPPPPPKEIVKSAPKVEAPPPPFVPPPEVTPPSTSAPTIAAVTTPPTAPTVIAPPPPPVVASGPVRREIAVVCPTQVRPEMPKRAQQDGIEGTVRAQVLIRNGAVVRVDILSGPPVFHAVVREAMLNYRCAKDEADALAVQEFTFKLD
jgi:protein TonB